MTKERVYTLPSLPDKETLTRRAIAQLALIIEQPIYLQADVVTVDISSSALVKDPIFTVTLLVQPPEGFADLVPIRIRLTRRLRAPSRRTDSFWFEEALGHLDFPWGETKTETQLRDIFQPWIGKKALVKVELIEYRGVERIHYTDIVPEDALAVRIWREEHPELQKKGADECTR